MSLSPQKFREIVFQLIFSKQFESLSEDQINLLMQELKVSKKYVLMAVDRAQLILAKLDSIDADLKTLSESYEYSRIHQVEKAVLRLGAYEICFDENIPDKVAIAEAIRLCKKFSTKESISFINALLDKLAKQK